MPLYPLPLIRSNLILVVRLLVLALAVAVGAAVWYGRGMALLKSPPVTILFSAGLRLLVPFGSIYK